MFTKLMTTAAIGGAMIGAAVAQNAAPPAGSASGNTQFINSQASDQWLSSNFVGTDVLGPDGAKIGDVHDVLFEKDGQVVGYVVGVGGFLGIGAKNVALSPSSFQVVPGKDTSDTKLKLNMTKDQLQQAASFETIRDKEAAARRAASQTTGSGGGMPTRPAPSGN